MLIGYLLSGVGGGALAATAAFALGHSAMMALTLYSLFGMLAMLGFGLVCERGTSRD